MPTSHQRISALFFVLVVALFGVISNAFAQTIVYRANCGGPLVTAPGPDWAGSPSPYVNAR